MVAIVVYCCVTDSPEHLNQPHLSQCGNIHHPVTLSLSLSQYHLHLLIYLFFLFIYYYCMAWVWSRGHLVGFVLSFYHMGSELQLDPRSAGLAVGWLNENGL